MTLPENTCKLSATCSDVEGFRNHATFSVCVAISNNQYLYNVGRCAGKKDIDARQTAQFWKVFATMYGHFFEYNLVEIVNDPSVDWEEVLGEMRSV